MINFHQQHLELHQELHARPYPKISSPCVISHIAYFHDKKNVNAEYACINELAKNFQVNGIANDTNSYFQEFGSFSLRWENHREFSTLTIISPTPNTVNGNATALDMFPEKWLSKFPGKVVSATNVMVNLCVENHSIETHLGRKPSIACRLIDNQVTLWTSLHLDKQGFTRFYISDNSQIDEHRKQLQLGSLVLKILEIETYRQMALLALPVAKSIAPVATELGQKCAGILETMTKLNSRSDESRLLQELTNVAAEVEKLRASSSYRFSATIAYAELVNSRLEELDQQKVENKDLLGDFILRRFMPAIRTCKSVQLQLESLSKRLTRASDLLRTRVDQTIAEQNKKLLESMNRRSHLQLRLQQTVEGLSVAAISYYLISLLKIFTGAINKEVYPINENLIIGFMTPVVLIGVFLIVRRMKKHFTDNL